MTTGAGRAQPFRPLLRWLALFLFALLTFLPAQSSLPVTDRDEARFVTASRQMVETGDFIDIRFQDEARHKKPVGIYWLQSAAVLASGQGVEAELWVYRLVSLAGAVLSVLLVALIGAPILGPGPALIAAALFAAGFVIGGEARIAKTDAALLATILISQAALARAYLQGGAGRGLAHAFWLSVAAGVLIKGPIGPLVPALTALALVLLDRRAAWLRPFAAPLPILAALLVAVPWFVAISLRSDGAFWTGSVGADLLPKVAAGQEGKGAPPGSYVLAQFVTFWPAAPLLLLAIPAIWRARRTPATRFLLAWAVPVWILYEAIPTKLLHYTLPAYPALALLTVMHLPQALATAPRWLRLAALIAVLPGLGLGAYVLSEALGRGPAAIWPIATALAAALAVLALALNFARQGRALPLAAAAAAAGAILHAGVFVTLARLPQFWPSQIAHELAEATARSQGCAAPQITGWGYGEPSLVWLGGRDTRLLPADTPAATALMPGPCVIVVRNTGNTVLPQGAVPHCSVAGQVEGLAIGAGRRVRLDVLACQGTP